MRLCCKDLSKICFGIIIGIYLAYLVHGYLKVREKVLLIQQQTDFQQDGEFLNDNNY